MPHKLRYKVALEREIPLTFSIKTLHYAAILRMFEELVLNINFKEQYTHVGIVQLKPSQGGVGSIANYITTVHQET